MLRPLLLATMIATAAAAEEPFAVDEVLEGPVEGGGAFRAIRETGGFWWIEVEPGIFAPWLTGPAEAAVAARTDGTAEGIAALERLSALPRPDLGYDPAFWCIDWTTAAGQPRRACME